MPSPPGPKGKPFIGSLQQLRDTPLESMAEWHRTYGDVVGLRVAGLDVFLLTHPDLVEEVLVTGNRNFIKPRLLRDTKELLGEGLLTSEGDFWLRQRRLSQPAFHRDRIAGYASVMTSYTDRMLARWTPGEERDIHHDMMELTLEIVARTLFNTSVTEEARRVGDALEVALERFVDRLSLTRYFDRLPLPKNLRFQRARRTLDTIIYGVIEQRRRSGEDTGDLLSMLLQAQDEDGSGMSDLQLRDEVMTLFLAGHETTAIALCWTLYLLSRNPDVDAALQQELRSVLDGRTPTMDDIPTLVYTGNIIRESMRLYPPAWRVGREAIADCMLGGYRIPAGAQIIMSQWLLHRDPRFWNEPERFDPTRWTPELDSSLPRFAYFPFGGGQRRCIGDTFAIMEATLILATIAGRYRLELSPDQKIGFWPSITLRPRFGMRMRVVRREEIGHG
jgi:cytochrome P450